MEVNYKNKKYYNTAKKPIRQPFLITVLIYLLSKLLLLGKDYKIEKINMKGLKPPYLLFSNHMYFIDFEIASVATFPHRVNNIVTIDGYYRRPWLMELIGSICKRKFVSEIHTLRSIKHVIKNGDVLCMYPEARYSPCGITSYLPETLGNMIKMNKVPVVVIIHRGNYLHSPFWNFRKKRKVPLRATMTQILTAEDVERLSAKEIFETLKSAMQYDEYDYQKQNNILIKEDFRAEGIHKILYQCPHCKTESQMDSKGHEIFCNACQKRWTLNEDGSITAQNGKTEFSRVPDWFNWEKTQVRNQIINGEYSFFDEVDVYSLPRCMKFEHLGKAKLSHTPDDGFVIEGFYNNAPYRVQRTPQSMNSLHVEYDYCYIKPYDCIDISTEKDSFYCYPTKQNVITKLAFATEILHEIKKNKTHERSDPTEK